MARATQSSPRKITQKDKQRERTRAKLLSAASSLFAEFGYEDVSVTEIARSAGVTHSMINVYFGGKPGLIYEIVRQNNDPQLAATQEIATRDVPARERLESILWNWINRDVSDPRLASVMFAYSWSWSAETEDQKIEDLAPFLHAVAKVIQDGQKSGDFAAGKDPEMAAEVVYALYTWGIRPAVLQGANLEDTHESICKRVFLLLQG